MHKNKYYYQKYFFNVLLTQTTAGNSFQAVQGFTKNIFYAVHSQVLGCEAGKVADGSNCAAHNSHQEL